MRPHNTTPGDPVSENPMGRGEHRQNNSGHRTVASEATEALDPQSLVPC